MVCREVNVITKSFLVLTCQLKKTVKESHHDVEMFATAERELLRLNRLMHVFSFL